MRKLKMGSLLAAGGIACSGLLVLLAGCGSSDNGPSIPNLPNVFTRTNLVSDKAGFTDSAGAAAVTDPNLKNPWGMSFSPTSPFWISDNGTGVATLYDGTGAIKPLVVNIPTPTAATGGAVTGQVFNPTTDFAVTTGAPARFIFATEDGTIAAWASGTSAVLKANNSGAGAIYKGLALGTNSTGNFLFAANFNAGTIDVFDKNFAKANPSGSFTDPNVPAGYAPFNIQNIGGSLYVTYAKQDAQKHNDVPGAGNGLIDVFSTDGRFVRRFATGSAAGGSISQLNSPWGITMAPADFGRFSNTLLVGNFGSGQIDVFDPSTMAFLGQLDDATGQPMTIPGLWALAFGNGAGSAPTNVLFFTAGINGEQDGLFGSIAPATRKVSARK